MSHSTILQFVCDRCAAVETADSAEFEVPEAWSRVEYTEGTVEICGRCYLQLLKFLAGEALMTLAQEAVEGCR